MKNFFLIFIFFLFSFSFVNAEINIESWHTLIDCVNWNNDSWIAFDNSKPFATLKKWIEKTIEYINSNINYIWNEQFVWWKVFNIKVNCSFNDILNPDINLNFLGQNFNNELIIEWIWEKSLVIKNIGFHLSNWAWNITFKNAIFVNDNKPYFYDYIFISDIYKRSPFSNWIKIIDSYIVLKNWNNIWNYDKYQLYFYQHPLKPQPDYIFPFNYVWHQMIENSIIDIEVWKDFDFRMPVIVKNSKINFTNSWSNLNLNIRFIEDWNTYTSSEYNSSVFYSNIIDLWWNNLTFDNDQNIAFLNNKIINFNNIDLWGDWIFVNNYFDNNQSIDISLFKNLFNNVFKSGYIDSYDLLNNRKNYSFDNIWNTWIGWVYKRLRNNKYFNIDINSALLYKEITWQDLVWWLWNIYVIFNY